MTTVRLCDLLATTLAALALATTAAVAQVVRPVAADSPATASDSLTAEPTDTLREVIVTPRRLPVEEAVRRSLGNEPRRMTMGDVLEKLSPGINDKITHPFAIKARRRERRRKRWMERIEALDHVQTFDELLREAYERQMREDSLARITKP